jgi:hypothetical protein
VASLPLSVARRFGLVECEPVGQIPVVDKSREPSL